METIILLALLGIEGCFLLESVLTIKKLKTQISDCERASIQSEATYHIHRMDNDYAEFQEYNNYWAVYRSSSVDGRSCLTTIKIFTDPDPDSNLRKARELCDLLNSK